MKVSLSPFFLLHLQSIDQLELEIKQRCGTEQEIHYAKRILPVLHRRHLLLVTLLLFNSLAAEALPLFLDNLVPSYVAVIISVTMVLFFGEIFPSAFFSGPNQLKIAASLSGLVWFLMALFLPIAFPVARFLDWFLGEEEGGGGKRYNRTELTALIEIHQGNFEGLPSTSFLVLQSMVLRPHIADSPVFSCLDQVSILCKQPRMVKRKCCHSTQCPAHLQAVKDRQSSTEKGVPIVLRPAQMVVNMQDLEVPIEEHLFSLTLILLSVVSGTPLIVSKERA